MIKLQKIGLWVGGALFLIPEILWSQTANIIYSFFQSGELHPKVLRSSFIFTTSNETLLKSFVVLQTIGLLVCIPLIWKSIKNINTWLKFLIGLIIFSVTVINLFAFYLVLMFNPSFP